MPEVYLHNGSFILTKDNKKTPRSNDATVFERQFKTASGKDKHLIFWPGLIVFNLKMTIFIQINREI